MADMCFSLSFHHQYDKVISMYCKIDHNYGNKPQCNILKMPARFHKLKRPKPITYMHFKQSQAHWNDFD